MRIFYLYCMIFFLLQAEFNLKKYFFISAMNGLLFKNEEEVSFGVYHLWYSLGQSLSFAYSNHLCTYVKIYILLSVLILGAIGYLSVEIRLRKEIKPTEK